MYKILERFRTQAGVQEGGITALTNLAMGDAALKRVIVMFGGLPYIYAAIDGHMADGGVQTAAMLALLQVWLLYVINGICGINVKLSSL